MRLKIIVNVFYKPSQFLSKMMELDNGRMYYPINGGCSLKNQPDAPKWLHYDDSGDSISQHNHALNEMTSIYWFWKNYDWKGKLDYIGFNHYRRFFKPNDFADYAQHDMIVAEPYQFNQSIQQQYAYWHNENDLKTLVGVLSKFSVHASNFMKYCSTDALIAPCNMFIMKSQLFDKYCTFMFPVLMQLLNKVQLKNRNKYQHRALAFLSERLTSWWVSAQTNVNIKQIPIYFKT